MQHKGKKLSIGNEEKADSVLDEIKKGTFVIDSVTERERKRKPSPPFTTSSLQQDASVKLNFNTKKTMFVAQQLYEGVDVKGKGTIGLVTYIRTDSVRISAEAGAAAKGYIEEKFGREYVGIISSPTRKTFRMPMGDSPQFRGVDPKP